MSAQSVDGKADKVDPTAQTQVSLLNADEPSAVTVERPAGSSEFVFICDHASMRLPKSLGTLGLSHAELSSHIAWDIGAARVAQLLSERLDATLVMQNYSRLVVDCNRLATAADSIPRRSEWVDIKGNEHLDAAAIETRRSEIFAPYHEALHTVLEQRQRARRQTILIAVHSFTPTYLNAPRPWSIGVMYRQDTRLATALLKLLRRDKRMEAGDNQPYAIEENDYSLPMHAESRGLPHVGIEIRQDLVADEAGQKTWAGRLASLLKQAAESMPSSEAA